MKNLKVGPFILFTALHFSCSTEEVEPSKIDQINQIGKELGIDLEIIEGADSTNAIMLRSIDELKNKIKEINRIHREFSLNKKDWKSRSRVNYRQPCYNLGHEVAQLPFGLATLNFSMKFNSSGELRNISAYLTGYTLGIAYRINNYYQSPLFEPVIDIYGTYSYVLFVEGIGTVYSNDYNFRISLDCLWKEHEVTPL